MFALFGHIQKFVSEFKAYMLGVWDIPLENVHEMEEEFDYLVQTRNDSPPDFFEWQDLSNFLEWAKDYPHKESLISEVRELALRDGMLEAYIRASSMSRNSKKYLSQKAIIGVFNSSVQHGNHYKLGSFEELLHPIVRRVVLEKLRDFALEKGNVSFYLRSLTGLGTYPSAGDIEQLLSGYSGDDRQYDFSRLRLRVFFSNIDGSKKTRLLALLAKEAKE